MATQPDPPVGYLSRLRLTWHDAVVRNARVQPAATHDTLRRLLTVAAVVGLINLGYAVLFLFFVDRSAGALHALWVQGVAWIHITNALALAVLAVLLAWQLRGVPRQPVAMGIQLLFGWAACAFGTALSVADQWVSSNTTMFALTNLSVAMLSLLRPSLAVL
jgi:hypothetical protein